MARYLRCRKAKRLCSRSRWWLKGRKRAFLWKTRRIRKPTAKRERGNRYEAHFDRHHSTFVTGAHPSRLRTSFAWPVANTNTRTKGRVLQIFRYSGSTNPIRGREAARRVPNVALRERYRAGG